MLTCLHAQAHHSGHTYVHMQLYTYNLHGTFSCIAAHLLYRACAYTYVYIYAWV